MKKDYVILAMDESQRIKDEFGNLTVLSSVITMEGVNPYYGRDIPNSEELGLEPNKVYYLYRPLEEIEKAVDSFKMKSILIKHVGVDAKDPKKQDRIGNIGSDLIIEDGKLYGDMQFYDDRAIELIEERKQEQLSAGYGYVADMTPGEFNGVHYDGIMRNLVGNHVALVERGRIGKDAIICDNQTVFINKEVNNMKFKEGGLSRLMESMQMAFDSGEEFTEEKAIELVKQADDEREEVRHDAEHLRRDLLERGVDAKIVDMVMQSLGGIDGDQRLHEKAEDEDKPKGLSEDEVNAIVGEKMRANDEKHEAINDVREVVGSVNPQAHDSAASVYKMGLDAMDVDTKDVPSSAMKSLYKVARSLVTKQQKPKQAFDSADGYVSRFQK